MSNKTATITRCGVVELDYSAETPLSVNSEDMIQEIQRLVKQIKPVTDWSERFAGRVTITVELIGDIQEDGA